MTADGRKWQGFAIFDPEKPRSPCRLPRIMQGSRPLLPRNPHGQASNPAHFRAFQNLLDGKRHSVEQVAGGSFAPPIQPPCPDGSENDTKRAELFLKDRRSVRHLVGSPRPIHCRTLRYESALPPSSCHSFRVTDITEGVRFPDKCDRDN